MRCLCGFDFVKDALSGAPAASTFAIIRDEDYTEVMRREAAYLACTDWDSQLRCIADAAVLVGNGSICPDCGNLCWLGSGESPEASFWKRESGCGPA